jgi:hypothetical protein
MLGQTPRNPSRTEDSVAMLTPRRKWVYSLTALAVLWFLFFPEDHLAVVGALILQTIAYIAVAGRSMVDGVLLSGISTVLIGLIPAAHPHLLRSGFLGQISASIMLLGVLIVLASVGVILRQEIRHS